MNDGRVFRASLNPTPGRTARILVEGELDTASSGELRSVVRTQLDAGRDVILEASRLRFIDSAGLSALLGLRSTAHELHRRLVVADPAPAVLKVMQMTGVASALVSAPRS